jgi:hypothetical protein
MSSICARVWLSSKSYPSGLPGDTSMDPNEVFGENSLDPKEVSGDTWMDPMLCFCTSEVKIFL